MLRQIFLLFAVQIVHYCPAVKSAKQQVQLSDSYLPVAMQVIAHLTDQMAFETPDKDEPSKPTSKPTSRPTSRPTSKPTQAPYVSPFSGNYQNGGWWMKYGIANFRRIDITTPHHGPGFYAPPVPPKPFRGSIKDQEFLLPIDHNSQYTVIEPQEKKTGEPLLSIMTEEMDPLVDPKPDEPLLPHYEDKSSRAEDSDIEEENLQYLSEDVRSLLKLANDPKDERLVDVWEGTRARPGELPAKGNLSSSNLRLLLLYDLLSREAKRQRLSDYSGFSPDVMKTLVDSASGGARGQLKVALSKMVERGDCGHDYANNRAREMVTELGKDESLLSSQLRYLQPLVYQL